MMPTLASEEQPSAAHLTQLGSTGSRKSSTFSVMANPITGVIAASVTPLTNTSGRLDESAFVPLVDFMSAAGLDGLLAMGTTGEGVLLDTAERKRVTELFAESAQRRLKVIVHAGAQTTRDTVEIAAHAAANGAD